jgi:DNA-binding CsgD family transcriptional regulator
VGQQQEGSRDLAEPTIQRLLRQRARERAAPLRWSVDSVILGYVCLAAVIIMSLRDVALPMTVVTAVVGIALVWLSSWFRIRKLVDKFYEEEMADYDELLHEPAPDRPRIIQAQSPAGLEESTLTPRELAVLQQIAQGKTNNEIASALQISPQTVKNHISHILLKLGVNDRTAAVLTALHRGWVRIGD